MNERRTDRALTGHVADALRLGCVGVGFTIYPGSAHRFEMYRQLRDFAAEAKRNGLIVVVWSYPRGSELSQRAKRRIDIGYCGAPGCRSFRGPHSSRSSCRPLHIEQDEARKVYEAIQKIPIATLWPSRKWLTWCRSSCLPGVAS